MSRLIERKAGKILAGCLIKAHSPLARLKGLLGRSGLKKGEALWIPSCSSIHTFFMKFPIDALFTDGKFRAVALFEDVPPGKILFGGFKSRNVFEMGAGQIQAHRLKKGDILYVEP